MIAWHVKEKAVKKAKANKDVDMRETRDGLIFMSRFMPAQSRRKRVLYDNYRNGSL